MTRIQASSTSTPRRYIYDSDGNLVDMDEALAMQDDIVRDDAGRIVTDAGKLDLHIDSIGKNKYQILNLKKEMKDPDGGVWRVIPETGNKYFDKDLVDDIIDVADERDEIYGGFVDGHAVLIIDEDVFKIYGGDFGIKPRDGHSFRVKKKDCIALGGGLYGYVLPEMPEGGMGVYSPHPKGQEAHIGIENGAFAQFLMVKEES